MNVRWILIRACQVVALGILIAYVLTYFVFSDPFGSQSMGADFGAYWGAADRIRHGEPLYPPLLDQQANDVYRYSAWFAVALVPATLLPYELAAGAWIALAFAAGAFLLWVTARGRTIANAALVMLVGPWIIENAWVGQAQLLIAAGLAACLNRRSGPALVGIAASLKAAPIVFAGYYVVLRQWRRAALAVAAFLALAAPTFLFDLTHYPTESSEIALLGAPAWAWPLLATAVSGAAVIIALRSPRYLLLAIGTIAIVALPRIHPINITYLLPALALLPREAFSNESATGIRHPARGPAPSLSRGDQL